MTKRKAKPLAPFPTSELAKIALDIADGRVIGSWDVPENLLLSVFMPLALMSEPPPPNVWHVYGYDPGHGICVNGYRVLWECRFIPKENAEELTAMLAKIQAAREQLKKELGG